MARHIRAMVICNLIAWVVSACTHATDPADTIRNAYAWYLQSQKDGRNPLVEKRDELRNFVTDAFLASIDNVPPDLESDGSFGAKISVTEVKVHGETAAARVSLTGRQFGERLLEVRLVKKDRTWKIDDVKLLE